jgi:hypothetical protein
MAAALRRDGSAKDVETTPSGRGPAAPSKLGDAPSSDRGPGPIARLRASDRHLGLWVGGALLVAVWLGWTAYVWTDNGAWSGIGVLISWPAVLAGLAVLTFPLWATWLLRRERQAEAPGEGPSEEAPDGAVEAGADRA